MMTEGTALLKEFGRIGRVSQPNAYEGVWWTSSDQESLLLLVFYD